MDGVAEDQVTPAGGTIVGAEVHYPDGRVELASADLAPSQLFNDSIAPVPVAKRTWTTYSYLALWMGISHGIPTWLLASGMISLGMSWYQAIITIALGNSIVLIPILLNSHAGTKYGITFPVYARASFGVFGTNLPALLRGFIACGWFGIQTWIGGEAIYTLIGAFAGDSWTNAASVWGEPWTLWLSFVVFWVIQMAIIVRGLETLRRFENWSAPLILVVAIFLLIWMVTSAGGFGPILTEPGELGWGSAFWPIFFPSLMAMIAYFAPLSLNMSDFTRLGGSQRQQAIGQIAGLPTTMTAFATIGVLTTSATVLVYGEPIWDPIELIGKFSSPIVILISLFFVVVATIAVNLAANTVSPSYDFSNALPKLISYRTGGLITGIIGVAFQPWKLLANPDLYIFTWLGLAGGLLGAIAGVLIADYWIVRKTTLDLRGLYEADGVYRYAGGWNWRAVVALAVGAFLSMGGAYSQAGGGPFPAEGVIPFLRPLYDYSWVVAIVAGVVVYVVLTKVFPRADENSAGTVSARRLAQPSRGV